MKTATFTIMNRKCKSYFELKHSQRTNRKRSYEQAFRNASEILHPDVKKVNVELMFEGGKVMKFSPKDQENDEKSSLEWRNAAAIDIKDVQRVLAIKDKYRLSDEALHELHMLRTPIPPKNVLKDEQNRLNSAFPLFQSAIVSINTF